ncbi:MAG TPA: CPBP family intramembrane glutamic endopeptidase [Rhodanobacteraceae bacterium]|jgi:hypothetical protein
MLARLREIVWIALVAGVMLTDWEFAIVIAAVIAIAAVAFETRAPLRALGMARPASIARTIVLGLGIGVVLVAFSKVLLTPIVEAITGIPRDLSAFDDIRDNPAGYLAWMPRIWIGAAIGEELLFRGFLIGRLEAVFGGASRVASGAAVLLSTIAFGAAHAYQGPTGIVITAVLGLLFAVTYLATKRNLWVGIFAHGTYDTISLALIATNYDRVLADFVHRFIPAVH